MTVGPPYHKPKADRSKRDRDKRHDEHRGSARARGYTSAWDKARRLFLQDHPLCRMCEERGWIVPAKVVDHIEPHRGNQTFFWDRNNWQPLCKRCHDSTKQAEEKNRAVVIGADGWPE